MQKNLSQKSDGVPNTCYKIVLTKFITYKLKEHKAKIVQQTKPNQENNNVLETNQA